MFRAGIRPDDRNDGPKLEFDPQWKGPLQVEREPTDLGFIIALIIYLFIWIGVGVYAFCANDMKSLTEDFDLDHFSSISSTIIYISVGFTILGTCLSLTFLILLRYLPRAGFFTSIFLNVAILALFVGYVVYKVFERTNPKDMALKNAIVSALIVIILFGVPTVILLAVYRRKVFIACEVVKESTKAVFFFPSSIFFSILPFTLYVLTTVFSVCTWACLYENSSTQNGDKPFHLYVLHGINLFGWYWMINFIYGFSQMVLAGTFGTWYWTLDRNQIPNWIVSKFIYIATRFHLGTLALGSLIIAIIEFLRNLLRSNSQRAGGGQGDILAFCLDYMCGVAKEVLEYINTNAYIMCAIHGSSFMQSAKDAFYLFKRNVLKFAVAYCVTKTIVAMAGLAPVFLSVLATTHYCQNMEIAVLASAAVIVFITTTLISTAIFNALETAINTIFLCVLEDDERNNGSRDRPYFMTLEMRQLLMRDTHGRYIDV